MRKMKRKLVWMLCASLIFAQTGGPGLTALSARAETAKKNGGGLPLASGSNGTEKTGQATPSNAEKDGGVVLEPQKATARALMESENTGDFVVSGGEYGTNYAYDSAASTLFIYSGTLTVKGKGDAPVTGRIVATASNAEPKVTIENLHLTAPDKSALEVGAGVNLTLTVSGENSLKGAEKKAEIGSMDGHGIHITGAGTSLTIAGDGALRLEGGDSTKAGHTCGYGIYNGGGHLELKAKTIHVAGGTSYTDVDGGAGITCFGTIRIDSCNLTVAGGDGGKKIDSSVSNGGAGITASDGALTIVNSQVEIYGGTGAVGNGPTSPGGMHFGGNGGGGVNWTGAATISIENSYVTMTGGKGGDNEEGGNGGEGGDGLDIDVQSSSLTISGSTVVMQGGTGGSGETSETGENKNGEPGSAENIHESREATYRNSILLSGTPKWTTGSVYGSAELRHDMTIGSGQTFTIPGDGALVIPKDRTLTIENDGKLINDGTLHNYGSIAGNVTGGQAAESTGALTITRAGAEVTQAYLGDTVTLTATIEKKEPEPQTRLRAFRRGTPNTVDFYWGDCLPENKLNTGDVTVTDGKATMDILLTEDLWTAGATSYPITAVYYGNKDLLDYDNLRATLLVLNDQPAKGEGYTVDYVKETAVAEEGYEIRTDSNAAYVTTEIPVTPGGTVFVRIPASERKTQRENPLPGRPASPVNLKTEAASAADSSDGKICGCQPGEYQIRLEGENGFGAWTDALADANGEITGLGPGTYQLRIPASQSEPRFAGKAAEVTVNVRESGGNTGEGEGGNTGGEEGGNTGEGEGGNTGEGEGGNTGEGEGGNTGEGEGGNTGEGEGGNTGGEEGGNTGGSEGGNTGEGGGHTGGNEDSDEDRDDSEAASGKPLELQKETPLPETEGSWFHHDDGTWGMKTPSGGEIRKDWVVYHQNWYYLDENGKMAAGRTEIGGKQYYFLKDPAKEGQMLVGWALESGTWYYGFEGKETLGEIRFGWVKIRGKWYYFGQDGGMLMNTRTPDGYDVGSDGAWIPGM